MNPVRVTATVRSSAHRPTTLARRLASLVAPLCAAAGLAWPAAPAAAQALPGAGNLLQQLPPAPPPPAPAPRPLLLQAPGTAPLPASAPFEVRRLQIGGHTLFDTATLHALVAEAEGQQLTLQQLADVAARITAHYQRAGYPLARALIPAQRIEQGVVRIEVIEARYGRVELDNRSRIATPLLRDTLAALQSGQPVAQAALDRVLLLLSDLPGSDVGATLKPGAEVGMSDLWVQVDEGPALAASATLDNQGNRYTGRWRASAQLALRNPLGQGDELGLSALSSGPGTRYARLDYGLVTGGAGTRLSGAASVLNYRLGDAARDLNGHGSALVQGLALTHPLLRSADRQLRLSVQADRARLRDRLDAVAIRNDRSVRGVTLTLQGALQGDSSGSGHHASTLALAATRGEVDIHDAAAAHVDAATARTQDRYTLLTLALTHLQALGPEDSLWLTLHVQQASRNLDASQKAAVGGPAAVRGHDTGTLSADGLQLLRLEWRHTLDRQAGGRWQAALLYDGARAQPERRPWTEGARRVHLNSAGAALAWAGDGGWQARATVAVPLARVPEGVPSQRSPRLWAELGWRL